jgi:hypothetical protein
MGATVHLHFCMNEFVGWSLFQGKDAKCGKCGMEEKDKGDCCKDEHKHFKLKTDHPKSNVTQLITFNATPALFAHVIDFDIHYYSTITETYPTSHVPPDINRKRLHILYSVFLI